MKKKLIRSNPTRKYNKLFKFLTFDLSFLACIFITVIILLCLFATWGFFEILEIKELENIVV